MRHLNNYILAINEVIHGDLEKGYREDMGKKVYEPCTLVLAWA